jgi:hypothetical protein
MQEHPPHHARKQGLESRMTPKGSSPVCAVRRVVISLLQAGGTEERFLGYWHIWRRNLEGTKHAREAVHAPVVGQGTRRSAPYE